MGCVDLARPPVLARFAVITGRVLVWARQNGDLPLHLLLGQPASPALTTILTELLRLHPEACRVRNKVRCRVIRFAFRARVAHGPGPRAAFLSFGSRRHVAFAIFL